MATRGMQREFHAHAPLDRSKWGQARASIIAF